MSKSETTKKSTKNKPKKATEFKKIIRIAEADLDGERRLEHALTAIKGISWNYANAVRKVLDFENKKISEFSEEEIKKLKDCLENPTKYGIPKWVLNRRRDYRSGKNLHLLSSSLILSKDMDIKRLKNSKCYRGMRHRYGYKVRGQRTRSSGAGKSGRAGSTVGVVRKKQQPSKAKK